MQLTDQVYVIKEFIYNGNRYAASKRPYLYGELPVSTRDNRSFVVPVNEVEITSSIPATNVTHMWGAPAETIISKENLTRTLVPQVEELPIIPTVEAVEELPVITEDTSDSIPNITEQTKAIRKTKAVTEAAE